MTQATSGRRRRQSAGVRTHGREAAEPASELAAPVPPAGFIGRVSVARSRQPSLRRSSAGGIEGPPGQGSLTL